MIKKSIWDSFTNKYPLSKTLRFELKPIGRTLENIKKKGLIEEDEQREKDFNKVKKIMDEYYKYFIEKCLFNINIEINKLKEFESVYINLKKDPYNNKLKKIYGENQKRLRLLIFNKIKQIDSFKNLFKKEILNNLINWIDKKRVDDLKLIKSFKGFTTYFTGFFKNRENVFSEKNITTSIIYRIVHNNLPKFIDNIERFKKLKKFDTFNYKTLENNFKKELNNLTINDFFSLNNFKNVLNQSGIDSYNLIIGGLTTKEGVKIKGLNELINEFSQKQVDKNKQKEIRRLKLVPLFKQILSDKTTMSFVIEEIKNDEMVFKLIDNFYKTNNFTKIKELLLNLESNNLKFIYLTNKGIKKISNELFSDFNKINELIKEFAITKLKLNKEDVKKLVKKQFFSIEELEKVIKLFNNNQELIINYFSEEIKNKIEMIKEKFKDYKLINKTNRQYKLISEHSEMDIEKIKLLLDSIMELYHFIKPLSLTSTKQKESFALETDSTFYAVFDELFIKLEAIIGIYNKIRNYVTKKPFSTKKFKLNFENSTLLAGWDKNKETDNWSIILIDEKYYYLGIMSKGNNNIFNEKQLQNNLNNNEFYKKVNYKLLPSPNKDLPKIIFSKKWINFFNPSKEILSIRNHSSFTKNGTAQKDFNKKEFNINDCHKMINFYKECIKKYDNWSVFDFKFKKTEQYNDISEFYNEIKNQGYKITFSKVSKEYINKLVNEGKLYLFKIWNKDFSKYSKGKPNLHTTYWKELFSEENLKNVVYKLNGQAEVFYRKASIPKKITHLRNKPINNKNPINDKEKSIFNYDLIKDKRYTDNKFFFHCPITMNFKSKDNSKLLNKELNKFLKKTDEKIKIIGIDRGERNLVNYVLIDSKGKIIKQETFNIVSDDLMRKLNYQEKLDIIEKNRDKARKNWKKISSIKKMKEGYLSFIIYKLSRLIIENNAIIILEDLNYGFKKGRFRIEKQVYQKFEKMLIDKLNYLVFKTRKKNEIGGSLKAYQLTNKFESFKKLGKQSGILYYINAWKTSKICPRTGFVNILYIKYKSINDSKDIFNRFNYIKYHKNEDLFEFNFNYSNFSTDKKTIYHKLNKNNWSIWSNGEKLVNIKKNNNWKTEKININEKLKELFNKFKIDYKTENNIKQDILKQESKYFFENLIIYLKNILQLRNSYTASEVKEFKNKLGSEFNNSDYDYILSCVKDENGEFFDSRNPKKDEVKDADANGAYHIALKGLMLINKIKKAEENEEGDIKPNLKIENDSFINFVINKGK